MTADRPNESEPLEPPTEPRPTEPPSGRSPWPGRILGVAVIAAVVIAGVVVRQVIFAPDPYDQALRDATEPLMESADFKARYGTVSEDEAQSIGVELGAQAIAHLSDSDLQEYFAVTRQIIEALEPETCAGVLAGSAESDAVMEAAKQLDLDTFTHYVEVLMAGARSELAGEAPPPAPTEAQLQGSFVALADELGQDRALEVFTVASDPASHSAEEACAATLELLSAILELPDADRQGLLRFMAAEASAG